MIESSLLNALSDGKISKEEFIRQYFQSKIPSDEYVLDLIEEGVRGEIVK